MIKKEKISKEAYDRIVKQLHPLDEVRFRQYL